MIRNRPRGLLEPGVKVLQWTPAATAALEATKDAVASATLLVHRRPEARLGLFVDISDTGLGAALHQLVGALWLPLGFFSKKLGSTQAKYSAYDQDLLAIYKGVKRFWFPLKGWSFTVFSDHKLLSFALQQKAESCSPRRLRQLEFITQFTTDIRHISGSSNTVADVLSWVEEICCNRFDLVAEAQAMDPELQELLSPSTSLWLKCQQLLMSEGELVVDTSTGTARPYLPPGARRNVFDTLYNLSHPGVCATTKLVAV